jgi:hypothetical protein
MADDRSDARSRSAIRPTGNGRIYSPSCGTPPKGLDLLEDFRSVADDDDGHLVITQVLPSHALNVARSKAR